MYNFIVVQVSLKGWIVAGKEYPTDLHLTAVTKKLRTIDNAEKVCHDLETTDWRFWSELTTKNTYDEGTFQIE